MLKTLVFAALLGLAACGQAKDPTATASTGPVSPSDSRREEPGAPRSDLTAGNDRVGSPRPMADRQAPLGERLACVEKAGGIVVIGHRGGPTRDYPANALETFQRTLKAGTPGMEIDIARSRDGKLYLMHDDELDRATTGKGATDDLSWSEISKLNLRSGKKVTEFHPAALDDVLAWAVDNHALLELDRKKSTPVAAIVDAVRSRRAENNVLMVTYNVEQAAEVHKAGPDLLIAATANSAADVDRLIKAGVPADRLVAWTGTDRPDPELWRTLKARGIPSVFGTLGPRDSSLDTLYWKDGDGSEYRDLVAGGLTLLVTNLTDKVSREVSDAAAKARACGF